MIFPTRSYANEGHVQVDFRVEKLKLCGYFRRCQLGPIDGTRQHLLWDAHRSRDAATNSERLEVRADTVI